MFNKFHKIIAIVLFLFLISSYQAHGQAKTATLSDITESVDIKTTPASPGPNQNISIRAESYSFDLNSSEVIWALNGVIKDRGVGKKDFDFKTGETGSASLIKIIIKTKDGKNIEKSLVIRPAGVDIVWQADSYVPPFYKGKALYGYQDRISIIAVPDIANSSGAKINPENLIYKWTKDGKVLGGVSGYGKNKFSFTNLLLSHPTEIEVEVTSSDRSIRASGNITVEPIQPKVIFYENNPLYGIMYEKAINQEFKMGGSEITLSAEPYFFGLDEIGGQKIKYDWNMNGQDINNRQNSREITFRNTDGGTGSTRISIDLQNSVKDLQSASADAMLNFEASGGNKTVSF